LEIDEEYVEDIHAARNIEEILCATYERKTIGQGYGTEEGSPFQIQICVEPITPCVTKTYEEEKSVS
jgi:hypothetical protein